MSPNIFIKANRFYYQLTCNIFSTDLNYNEITFHLYEAINTKVMHFPNPNGTSTGNFVYVGLVLLIDFAVVKITCLWNRQNWIL